MIVGSIHGRFQPFHKGHARYLNEALKRCDHLIIGITQPDIQNLGITPEANHRSVRENNPLTYNQRCKIISAYVDENFPQFSYEFCPFPIEKPETLKDFIPLNCICFTTQHTEWNKHKITTLENQGFTVDVLMNPDETITKDLSAINIRKMIRNNDKNWKLLMPEASANKLVEVNGVQSIQRTQATEGL